ncbi:MULTISPECIES: alpha/beta fold hydrolase [unclassified Variovorax]|uniref:alpha/beta fold hydrolase n=1 Tax=unclassified Variovorax TaxID=663243 RepID=UPI0008CAA206|nr:MULTISPECIES: alpha/beta fold hydrolase [unclassified Variovorax]SEK01877.1 Pimeloyl-ACP methyl ester carboxylesterase [Variovorax sp. OK202]SFD32487.1 Pimeloyl-ACP methyl ester carboxylesterase [Variovorax sp. OK212]
MSTLDTQAPTLSASELARLDARFPARNVAVGGGAVVSVRECGQGPVVVCLHGIGSGAASWLDTAALLASQARLIAWDAPGYGESTPLDSAAPSAADYAKRLGALLDALGIDSCVLVGHSLGAITAASAASATSAARTDKRIRRLVLVSPAVGYGAPERAEARAKVRTERLATLDELGIAGMAAKRAGRLVSDKASDHARQWVRWNMARLNDHGYRQAVELLCNADLLADLPPPMPVRVACGALDVVTPPAACAEVARRCGVPLELLDDAGHAGYVEQPQAVATLLRESLAG